MSTTPLQRPAQRSATIAPASLIHCSLRYHDLLQVTSPTPSDAFTPFMCRDVPCRPLPSSLNPSQPPHRTAPHSTMPALLPSSIPWNKTLALPHHRHRPVTMKMTILRPSRTSTTRAAPARQHSTAVIAPRVSFERKATSKLKFPRPRYS